MSKHEVQHEVHNNSGCDGCRQEPIIGKRYRCKDCEDVDFCEYCVTTKAHNNLHTFLRIMAPVPLPKAKAKVKKISSRGQRRNRKMRSRSSAPKTKKPK